MAKGEKYVIHAVPQLTGEGVSLVHTTLPSGRMKVILSASTSAYHLAMAFDRWGMAWTSVVGLTTDDQRLYVLTSTTSINGGPLLGGAGQDGLTLEVFWREDGSKIHSGHFEAMSTEKVVFQPPTLAKGPLVVVPQGIDCLGNEFRFDGKLLKKKESPPKK